MYLMPVNRTLKNSYSGQFSVLYVLPDFEKNAEGLVPLWVEGFQGSSLQSPFSEDMPLTAKEMRLSVC